MLHPKGKLPGTEKRATMGATERGERSLMKDRNEELFELEKPPAGAVERRPLAERMRPRTLEEFVGQQHLLGPNKVLQKALDRGCLFSMMLWGPPGCGKTALALLLARGTGGHFVAFSAVLSGVKEIREVIQEAESEWSRHQKRTVLFVDEIHRFNKAQQDAFLPHVENGRIVLIGATTENPSFEINKALQSRTKLLVLHPLSEEEIRTIVRLALEDTERGLGPSGIQILPDALEFLCRSSQGDARRALNTLELAAAVLQGRADCASVIRRQDVEEALQEKGLLYDKRERNITTSSPPSSRASAGAIRMPPCYWMARMLEAGEDPLFIVAADGDLCLRGHRQRRSRGPVGRDFREGGGSFRRPAGGHAQPLPGCDLSGHCAEEQRLLPGLPGSQACGPGTRIPAGSSSSPERSHRVDEGTGLWEGLCLSA